MWLDSELIAGPSSNCVASLSSSSSTLLPSSSLASLTSTGSSKKGKRSQFERKLGEFFKHQISPMDLQLMRMDSDDEPT
ncbi:hypothetical protein Nepgr_014189 [Nepenthes gracilis]|uniref:Protein DA1-like domain-containing protein n=1 Tax=Nepenthes gracilis TaxID=150966 RepID=A0AAD3SJ15_NEPGR|nr:hypothetical protein Nepgr_014189 [Nepenthes gracilis]